MPIPRGPCSRPARDAALNPLSPTPKHLLHFEGGNALSEFRAQALLPRLQAVVAAHHGRRARATSTGSGATAPLDRRRRANARQRCCATATPSTAPAERRRDAGRRHAAPGHRLALGLARPPTSPTTAAWPLHRVERVTEYRLTLQDAACWAASKTLDRRRAARAAAVLLHDRMTESVLRSSARPPSTCSTSSPPSRWRTSTCWAGGRGALVAANAEFGLALSDDEIDYLRRRLHAAWAATRPTSS